MSILNFEDQSYLTKLVISGLIGLILIRLLKRIYVIFKLPPGPYGLPIVGYIPFLSEHLYEDYIKLGKRYGSPFSIHLGKFDFIIINDCENILYSFSVKEASRNAIDSLMVWSQSENIYQSA